MTKSVVSNSSAMARLPGAPIRGEEIAGPSVTRKGLSPFNFRAPLDNIVIRTFQFPMRYASMPFINPWGLINDGCNSSGAADKYVKVTEVMGESRFSFTIPMQAL